MPSSYPTFKRGQTVYASRIGMGVGACWTFDEPCRVMRRATSLDGAPAYVVRYEDGGQIMCVAESLSDVPVSYPRLNWLEVLDARGLPRPAGF